MATDLKILATFPLCVMTSLPQQLFIYLKIAVKFPIWYFMVVKLTQYFVILWCNLSTVGYFKSHTPQSPPKNSGSATEVTRVKPTRQNQGKNRRCRCFLRTLRRCSCRGLYTIRMAMTVDSSPTCEVNLARRERVHPSGKKHESRSRSRSSWKEHLTNSAFYKTVRSLGSRSRSNLETNRVYQSPDKPWYFPWLLHCFHTKFKSWRL